METNPGTPRLTRRSAAKQVNTPLKAEEYHESNDHDKKEKGSARRGKRKVDSKPKTNGNAPMKIDEESVDGNSLDNFESESSISSEQQQCSSPKSSNQKSPLPRRSLRARRSITPCPEILETNSTKKLKRSTSESKLDSISTPNKRRMGRAQSESKDFVFTPSKETDKKLIESENVKPSNSKTLVIKGIESIVEDDEESSQEDPLPLSYIAKQTTAKKDRENISKEKNPVHTAKEASEDNSKTESNFDTNDDNISLKHTLNNEVKENSNEPTKAEKYSVGELKAEVSEDQCQEETKIIVEPEIPIKAEECSVRETKAEVSEDLGQEETKIVAEPETPVIVEDREDECSQQTKDECISCEVSSDQLVVLENQNESTVEKTEDKGQLVSDNNTIDIEELSEENTIQEIQEKSNSTTYVETIDNKQTDITHPNTETEEKSHRSQIMEEGTYDERGVNINSALNDNVEPQLSEENAINQSADDWTLEMKSRTSSLDEMGDDIDCKVDKEILKTNTFSDKEHSFQEANERFTDIKEKTEDLSNDKVMHQNDDENNDLERKQEANNFDNVVTEVEEVNINEKKSDVIEEAVLIEDSDESPNEEGDDTKMSYPEAFEETTENENQLKNSKDIEFGFTKENNSLPKRNDVEKTDQIEIFDDNCDEDQSEIKIKEVLFNCVEDFSNLIEKGSNENSEAQMQEGDENKQGVENEKQTQNDNESLESYGEDIYKDMSNFGSEDHDDEHAEDEDGEQIESYSSGSSSSEDSSSDDEKEDIAEVEDDEEPLEKDIIDSKNVLDNVNKNAKINEQAGQDQRVHQKLLELQSLQNKNSLMSDEVRGETTSPMTYDKALAMLNKGRDKLIDDEEFFDMFTQELNKVSEPEENSDSDIAIVDEYIPEDRPKPKPVIKTIKRQMQRPSVPVQQHYPPPTHFGGHFHQVHNQHPMQNPPPITRMGFPTEVMFNQHHQYNQDYTHIDSIRNPNVYSHYGPSTSSASDPRMFDPRIQAQVPPEVEGFFAYKLGHSTGHSSNYSSPTGLKIKSTESLSANPLTQVDNEHFVPPRINSDTYFQSEYDQKPRKSLTDVKESVENKSHLALNEPMERSSHDHEKAENYTPTFKKETEKVQTPILDLLGLDKGQLNELKLALGLKKHVSRKLKKEGRTWSHPEKSKKKALVKHLLNRSKVDGYKAESSSSCETFKHDYGYTSTSRDNRYQDSSTEESSSESEQSKEEMRFDDSESSSELKRKIKLKKGGVSITIPGKKERRHRRTKRKLHPKSNTNLETLILRNQRKHKRKSDSEEDSSEDQSDGGNYVSLKRRKIVKSNREEKSSHDEDETLKLNQRNSANSKKVKTSRDAPPLVAKQMIQKKQKTTKTLPTQCGTFKVEQPVSSSSDSEHLSQSSSSDYLEELKKKIKIDRKQGVNKLSNIFTQQSFKALKDAKTGPGKIMKKKQKRQANILKKLPIDILEQLAEEEKTHKETEAPLDDKSKKRTRRTQRFKVKSAAIEEEYIPCVTAGATHFTLNRLDKEGVLEDAHRAANFRTNQLYGSSVKRITILDFKG